MKAAVLTGIRQMEIKDVPEPKIEKDNDVLLKIEVVGVCGSDVHYYETGRIGSQVVQYPFIVGHECSATVKAVGDSVTRVKVGDQVVAEPAVSCHECDQCRQDRENTCDKLRFLGTPGQGDGCLCEYIVMPQESCFPTNGAIRLEQAALCEPFAIGVYSVKQSQISKNAKVAILGAGPIGLSCMAAAQAEGVGAIYMTDKLDYRVQIAKKAGAVWAGNPERNVIPSEAEGEDIIKAILQREPLGMDIVYECAGQQETLDEAVELLKPGGRLMLIGIPRSEHVWFSIDKLRRKELSIINVRRQNKCTQKAIDLIAEGSVDIDFMITHRFKLEQTKEAFDMVAGYRDGVVKALIEFGC
jgi:L-iditol 2-dehydrogenase